LSVNALGWLAERALLLSQFCRMHRSLTTPPIPLIPPHPPNEFAPRSNFCFINVFPDRLPGRAIVICVIDNLVKGASGQAVQNLNLVMGFPETTGLMQLAMFP